MAPQSQLAPSHPLILELASLRGQLSQYQQAAHQASIHLQGARLELALSQSQNAAQQSTISTLQAEVEILRQHPAPPPLKPESTALAELSLAHRRLSAKMDITESSLTAAQLELASAKQEIQRLGKEREGDRAQINEFRRLEEDREEELIWERGERTRIEEQKKLCDLALKEYSALVHSLDPSAVPPSVPEPTSNILLKTPSLTVASKTPDSNGDTEEEAIQSASPDPAAAISNLLIGQQGVQQLVDDFVSTMTTKEKDVVRLNSRVEELELSLSTVTKQLEEETAMRVAIHEERDKVLRDDASAARVVERYMTFTQKTHATVHMHLDNLRTRSSATISTLRKESLDYQAQLQAELDRIAQIRGAVDEMTESLTRETAGRRREVALRLRMVTLDEKRERKVEKWLDRVRRSRDGAEGAVLEPDALEILLDEGVEAVAEDKMDVGKEKRQAWKGFLGRRRANSIVPTTNGEESSVARVQLAEDLVNSLVQDLQIETERRLDLEKQRVEWLARDATEGIKAGTADGEEDLLVWDIEHERATPSRQDSKDPSPIQPNGLRPDTESTQTSRSQSPSPSPHVPQLRSIFAPLDGRFPPLESSLSSLKHSLESMRQSLPELQPPASPLLSSTTPKSPSAPTKKPFRGIALRRVTPLSDPLLSTILDNLHEVIEDARVDVEIAVSDNQRVYKGFEALLNVGAKGSVREGEVLVDAQEYVDSQTIGDAFDKLKSKIQDIESDLAIIKENIMDHQGAGAEEENIPTDAKRGSLLVPRSVWLDVQLKTVSSTHAQTASPLQTPLSSPSLTSPRANPIAVMGSMGRSFSASLIGAPRKVSGFAGGLYRPKKDAIPDERDAAGQRLMQGGKDEDVE